MRGKAREEHGVVGGLLVFDVGEGGRQGGAEERPRWHGAAVPATVAHSDEGES